VAEGRVLHELKGHAGLVWSIAFSPDGATLATGSWDKTARLWDASTGKTRAVLEGHKDAIRCVAFSPWALKNYTYQMFRMFGPGPTLATGSLDGDVNFWHNAPASRTTGECGRPITPLTSG
jgi:WD40 repeat protein